ncbi:peroxisomal acyl-coenzyme A oxidase 1-like [Tetranychus urticae]|uniref:peroxisomal acyl-coenzyme A oxidase 1-like n=1 Tax=Tetranychus urticae TaxID=32264 RepID=UPI000D65624D|nr:peroxisomal acyl-coenzyme A oxidase 1-like [Tetranychus urticae]
MKRMLKVGGTNCVISRERCKATFNIEKLTYFLESDQEKTERRRELEKKFYEDEFPNDLIKVPVDYLSHSEIYTEALIKAARIYFEAFNLEDPREVLGIADAYHYEASPLLLHFAMFIPALMGHCNDEQQARWLPDAIELKIIGTYAQTELGHGSYLKGLQTEAIYNDKEKTFTLNSPTLESIKWWPGGLGKTANHAIVQAQLFVDGVHRGLHPFMVQIRDLETHKPLPGIEVGELGPKLGFKAADNGYLKLSSVVIPKSNMLMKNAYIDDNGRYQAKKATDKLNLGTMLFVRVLIIDMMSFNISKAVTIATRYSAVRKQGINPDSKNGVTSELKIIDYAAQRYKLIPCIALSHACKAVFISLMSAFKDVNESMSKRSDYRSIPLLHAMSSGLKALTTDLGASAVEICRRACGGNGFLLASGLPRIFGNTVAACTYEGENTILYLQTARYLYKTVRLVSNHGSSSMESNTKVTLNLKERSNNNNSNDYNSNGNYNSSNSSNNNYDDYNNRETSQSIGYLYRVTRPDIGNLGKREGKIVSDVDGLLRLFSASAYYHCHFAFDQVDCRMRVQGQSFEKAWIECQVDLIKAAKSHLIYYMMIKYWEWVSSGEKYDLNISQVLKRLAYFYFGYIINENKGDFLAVGLDLTSIEQIQDELSTLMVELRNDMIPLVDAFDLHDMVLMSAIGCKDGNVYDRLFNLAKKAPLNQVDPNPSFIKYIKDLTTSKSKL